jgi:hypothetical protein
MSQLLNIFLEPAKVFAELKERPTFLKPALVVLLATISAAVLYFLTVDPDWFSAHQLATLQAANPELGKAELDAATQFMPGARMSAVFVVVFGTLVQTVVWVVLAAYYLLAGKIGGKSVGFRQGLSLATWSSMPMLFAGIVAAAGVLTSPAQTSWESVQLLNVDPLLVQLPLDNAWSAFAKAFSLLYFWCWFLAALGWRVWTRSGWAASIFVATLPWVLILGAWALFTAI